jgi:hypothetical protein
MFGTPAPPESISDKLLATEAHWLSLLAMAAARFFS